MRGIPFRLERRRNSSTRAGRPLGGAAGAVNCHPKGQGGNARAAGPAGRVERSTVELVTRNPENRVASPRAREQKGPLTDPQNRSRIVTCTRAGTQLAHPAGEGTLNHASPRGARWTHTVSTSCRAYGQGRVCQKIDEMHKK